ncbi:MAG: DUF3006 domain-containing protein [Methanoregula sp.]
MNVSIDRIENGVAVLVMRDDTLGQIHLPASLLPPGCVEGDILTLTLDRESAATAAAKDRVAGLIKKIQKHR